MENQLEYIVSALDGIKHVAPNGQPYWIARELMVVLGYVEWRNFKSLIESGKDAANNAGMFSSDHFVDFTEQIKAGKGANTARENCYLSRHACYLIAMNGSSTKPEIATAQSYFSIQTQVQEQQAQLSDEERRLLLRNRVKEGNKKLGDAAFAAGVTGKMFGVFHDAGYKGLYDGKGRDAIKRLKGISEKDDLLDCMGRVELAANEFRITQTEQKLTNDQVKGESRAILTHHQVGCEVREAIKKIGGPMPEDIPAAPSIKKLADKHANQMKKLEKGRNEN